ncbi:MAG: TonB-dependent receptor [Sediminibacterium sp.]|nr:TonB-dependent receptor [Sediminibacterium sp.]
MKKIIKLCFLLSLLAFTNGISAQQNTDQLTGKVISNQKPIENALVSLLKIKDSSLVKTAITDKNGDYTFSKIAEGSYLISANLVGFKKSYSPVLLVSGTTGQLIPTIQLEANDKELAEVTVSSKKPLVQQLTDRMVVNVDASPTNVGATALEVLEKSPGITVDKDGNISLKGKDGVMVYMDGRPSYLSGQDLANLLRSMQSNQLDQIEIMTNPPAKYDAAGKAGVINIKTKKNKVFGFNGSVTVGYGQGVYSRNNQSVNLNYRKNKINVFGTLSHNERDGFQDLRISRRFVNNAKQIVSYFDQVNTMRQKNSTYSGKIGIDYYASKKTTIGLVVNGFNNPSNFLSIADIDIFNANYILQSNTKANALSTDRWKNIGTNFNIRHLIDTAGKELTFDLDYLSYNSSNNMQMSNAYYNQLGQSMGKADTLLGNLPQDIQIYSAKIDYIHPLKKGAKFEAGLKLSYVANDANAIYDSVINGNKVKDLGRTNYFIYKENINAAYVNFTKPFSEKISVQLGLRAEHTYAKGDQVTTNIQFNRNYIQLFPTAYFQYAPNKSNSFVLNYGKRIRRPDYESLNPFIQFLDKYTFQQGNPNLMPEFSHNIELSHTFKGFLTTTLNYTNTTDIIQEVLMQNNATNETYIKADNIATQKQFGLAINASNEYTKWWSGNIYFNIYQNEFNGVINLEPVKQNATTAMINISQQFKFKKGWNAELSGFYRTEGLEGLFLIKPFGVINIGASKQVLKNKGTIRLNVRDIFWSQRIKGSAKYGSIDANFKQFGDNRVVNLSFTYRFSKGKAATSQRTRGGAQDEQSRVGAGGGNGK